MTCPLLTRASAAHFLGSVVFQSKDDQIRGEAFDENDLLDGGIGRRTLLLLSACIRDLAKDNEAKEDCQKCIYQKGSAYRKVPERNRLVFAIRDEVQKFVDDFVKPIGGTDCEDELNKTAITQEDISIQNMARALLEIRRFFSDPENGISPEPLLQFLLNKVLLIYVAAQDRDGACRSLTIEGDR